MIQNPIFIIGTERSGSNLLRAILNEHPDIAIPHPPHLLKEFAPLLGYYGDLGRDQNFRKLIHDAVKLVELHFVPWPIQIDAEEIFINARHRDLYCVFALIYEQYLSFTGKKRWGCKSTFMVHHTAEILQHHSDPRMIHLVRDGRDVAVSAKNSVFNQFHPYYVAQLWARQQREAFEIQKSLPAEKFLRVTYESLLTDPAREVRRICEFLNEEYREGLLSFSESSGSKKLSEMSDSWKNLSKPILSDNFGKFRRALSEEEILEFECVASEELVRFGYPLVNESSQLELAREKRSLPFQRARTFLTEKSRMLRVQALALLQDSNAPLRIRKRVFVELIRWKGRIFPGH